jgi:hypothetical protein
MMFEIHNSVGKEVLQVTNWTWNAIVDFLKDLNIIKPRYKKNPGWYYNEGIIIKSKAVDIELLEEHIDILTKLVDALKTGSITIY